MGINETRQEAMPAGGVRELTRISLLVALMSVSGYIVIPLPFSPTAISAQTMAVNIIALLLPPKQAVKTMLIYLMVGAAGLPVFLGGHSGIGAIAGPAGGYLFGFAAAALTISLIKASQKSLKRYILAALTGMPVIYLFGVLQMSAVTGMGPRAALAVGVLPFIPGDIFKCAAASFMAAALDRALKN